MRIFKMIKIIINPLNYLIENILCNNEAEFKRKIYRIINNNEKAIGKIEIWIYCESKAKNFAYSNDLNESHLFSPRTVKRKHGTHSGLVN